MTCHSVAGAVERRAALLVNVLVRCDLLESGSSAVTLRPGRALAIKGQTIQCVYDALNRLTQKTYPDSSSVDYVYDLVGKVLSVNDPSGTYGFSYDNMGRLIGTTTQYSFLPRREFHEHVQLRCGFEPDGVHGTGRGHEYVRHAEPADDAGE